MADNQYPENRLSIIVNQTTVKTLSYSKRLQNYNGKKKKSYPNVKHKSTLFLQYRGQLGIKLKEKLQK